MSDRVLVLPVTDELDALFVPYRETLTVGEVAELLGMTKQGIYLWLRDGVIPGYKVGTSWFILRDELKKALRAGSNQHKSQPPSSSSSADIAPGGGDTDSGG